jgi:hypothetical protein
MIAVQVIFTPGPQLTLGALGIKNYISLQSTAASNFPYGAVTVKNYTGGNIVQ